MTAVACILPAAGRGRRMGGETPKPLLPLGGEPVLARTLRAVRRWPDVAEIVLVLPAEGFDEARARCEPVLRAHPVDRVVPGAGCRQGSVARGLAALASDAEIVAVHDAVRPFASPALYGRVVAALKGWDGAVPVLPVTDTVKRTGEDGAVLDSVPRDALRTVQTPQVFGRAVLEAAYADAGAPGATVTDDASVVRAHGGRVAGAAGDRYNLKMTTPEDLRLAEALLAAGLVSADGATGTP